jgi:hypothetical protein
MNCKTDLLVKVEEFPKIVESNWPQTHPPVDRLYSPSLTTPTFSMQNAQRVIFFFHFFILRDLIHF